MSDNKYEKYEAFSKSANNRFERDINQHEGISISNVVVAKYIQDNKNQIRKFAATKNYNERHREVVRIIERELSDAKINDVEKDVIIKSLRKIGISSVDRNIAMAYITSFIVIYAFMLFCLWINNVDDVGIADYIFIAFIDIMVSIIATMVAMAVIADTKFRLFRVK